MAQKQNPTGGKAIPFISIDQKDGTFQVTSEAMMMLEQIPRNFKVSIISIAGPYRTGKSFLANRLLNQSKGFEIGSTTQACTKGIWLWNKPVTVSEDHVMLLMDTEGLSSTERSTNIDIKIFAISILLSSVFIYNQMGPVTENSLEDLSLVANLTNYIHISQSQNESGIEFKSYFPGFYWVLRDFYHDLEGQTPKQYLEECLQPVPGLSQTVLKKNQIREAIQKFFKERDCFTLIRPVADESKLAHIEDLKWEDLKSEFRRETIHFVKTVKRRLKPKTVNGKIITSSMFLQLAMEYTEAINSKETPTVLTALDRVVQAETQKIQDEVYEDFNSNLNEEIIEETLPMSKESFRKVIKKLIKKHKLELENKLATVLNFQEIIQETKKFIKRIQDKIGIKHQQNYSVSYHFSIGLLKRLFNEVENPFDKDQQFDQMSIHDYIKKWITITKDYKDNATSLVQWEVFADSIVKTFDNKLNFLQRELIDFDLLNGEGKSMQSMEDDNEMSTNASSQMNQIVVEKYSLNIFERVVEQINDLMTEQLNRLKVTLNESQASEKKLSQQKKSNDQFIALQKQQNEDLTTVKHDFQLKIEKLKREIVSRKQELESLKQVKELEFRNLKKNQDRQLKDKEEDIKLLELQKQQSEQAYNTSQSKVQELDSEKRKEISSIQNEIKKLEEDIEGLKNKMKNKENNPHYMQVNTFFGEVKEYIEQYKKCFNKIEDSKTQKMKLFELQKQLNEVDFKTSQEELKLKRQLDEELRKTKDELEQNFQHQFAAMETERGKIQTLIEKKQVYEAQLESLMNSISEARERQMNLQDQKLQVMRIQTAKEKKIKDFKKDLQGTVETQSMLEEKIYKLSIGNKAKADDKDILLMLLPQIHKAINGRQNNIKMFLGQMENEAQKAKILRLFQNFKISYD